MAQICEGVTSLEMISSHLGNCTGQDGTCPSIEHFIVQGTTMMLRNLDLDPTTSVMDLLTLLDTALVQRKAQLALFEKLFSDFKLG